MANRDEALALARKFQDSIPLNGVRGTLARALLACEQERALWEQRCKDAEDDADFEKARAERAEARVAELGQRQEAVDRVTARMRRAEARVSRLEEALREIADWMPWEETNDIARTALSEEEK